MVLGEAQVPLFLSSSPTLPSSPGLLPSPSPLLPPSPSTLLSVASERWLSWELSEWWSSRSEEVLLLACLLFAAASCCTACCATSCGFGLGLLQVHKLPITYKKIFIHNFKKLFQNCFFYSLKEPANATPPKRFTEWRCPF